MRLVQSDANLQLAQVCLQVPFGVLQADVDHFEKVGVLEGGKHSLFVIQLLVNL